MRLSISPLEALALLPLLASASLLPRQLTATSLYKFSASGARAENIAVRPSGQLLITRLDAPELWTIDPTTKAGSKVLTFPNTLSSAGITELTPDVFAVITGNLSASAGFTNKPGTWEIWKVDFSGGGATPKSSVVKLVSDSGFFNGLTSLNNDTVLIGDASKGDILKMTVSTGEYSVGIKDASMAPTSTTGFSMGIDGLRYYSGTVYWTNIFKNTMSKVAVDASGAATGSVSQIYSASGANPDDFCFGSDGTVYVALGGKNALGKLGSDGKMSNVASVASASACAFGRGEKDKDTVYVTSSNGAVFAVPLGS